MGSFRATLYQTITMQQEIINLYDEYTHKPLTRTRARYNEAAAKLS